MSDQQLKLLLTEKEYIAYTERENGKSMPSIAAELHVSAERVRQYCLRAEQIIHDYTEYTDLSLKDKRSIDFPLTKEELTCIFWALKYYTRLRISQKNDLKNLERLNIN